MNLFELQEVLYRSEYLLEIGTITPEMHAQLPGIINQRQHERTTRMEARQTALSDPDIASITQTPLPQPPTTPVQNQALVGTIIPFGGFEWRVLDVQDNQALIVTENVIMGRRYHHASTSVTWAASEIRQYLNESFFYTFSPQDRARIVERTVINHDNPWDWSDMGGNFPSSGGINTTDRIFLLSIDEVLQYFGDSGMVAYGATMNGVARMANAPRRPAWGVYGGYIHDQYSESRIALDLDGWASSWWLRSPGQNPVRATIIGHDGFLVLDGLRVGWPDIGIRPALWLRL